MIAKPAVLTLLVLTIVACSGEVYVRDGVTDGDTFYLAGRAMSDDDPGYQSWVTYSLARSTCQLSMGGDNPARASSYNCELTSRRLLLESWHESKRRQPASVDPYLDELLRVDSAGYLAEYVAASFRKRYWDIPADLRMSSYRRWMRKELPNHDPVTRITGSWNYSRNVSGY